MLPTMLENFPATARKEGITNVNRTSHLRDMIFFKQKKMIKVILKEFMLTNSLCLKRKIYILKIIFE